MPELAVRIIRHYATPWPRRAPAPVDVAPPIPVVTDPLIPDVVDAVVPPSPRQRLAPAAEHGLGDIVHAVEWEAVLTPRARLLLPGDQQFKFTAALARREVTVGPATAASTSCSTAR